MRSTFYGLEVARTGLYTSQNQLNLVGHNIANAETEGYTRERLNTAAIPATFENTMFAIDLASTAGRGSEALRVEQIRDAFLDMQFRQEGQETAYWSIRQEEFTKIESLFNSVLADDTSEASIFSALDDFYVALSDLAAKPESSDIRLNLQQAGVALTESFNYVYEQLAEQHQNANIAVSVTVDEINDYASQIANLNRIIYGSELSGRAQANDLRDQRNLLIDELSKLTTIDSFTDPSGQLVVTLGGRALVDGADSFRITVDPKGMRNALTGEMDQNKVVWEDALGEPGTQQRDQIVVLGGELKAYLDVRDGVSVETAGVPSVVNMLDEIARKIASEVNEVHRQGYTMPYTKADALEYDLSQIHIMNSGKAVQNVDGSYAYIDDAAIAAMLETSPNGTDYYKSMQGIDFFACGSKGDYSEVTAANFSLSDAVLGNVYMIAASSTPVLVTQVNGTNEYKGNAANLSSVLALFDKKDAIGNPDNFESKLKEVFVNVGTEMSHINTMKSAQDVRLAAIDGQRKSISSVSLDEELTNMVKFTHAYNASARILTAIDDELDTLINKMGTVGR
ncbi:MAG: flagellar hook-associated protein FlgK [Eubacteriales bacterium]|nr:flagellar hook-associated protein FlgK [Eubacteriales bacterium]